MFFYQNLAAHTIVKEVAVRTHDSGTVRGSELAKPRAPYWSRFSARLLNERTSSDLEASELTKFCSEV